MIPKIIHFVWFSKNGQENVYPKDVQGYMDRCKELMPDYEIRVWNQNNIDFMDNRFAREAYEEGFYAFASDYVRLLVLYRYGGIYMDTDVEVLRPLDDLLDCDGFMGFELENQLATHIIGAAAGNPRIKEMMDYYEKERFVHGLGMYNLRPNTEIATKILLKKGFVEKESYQEIDGMTIYPMTYFCPSNEYRDPVDLRTEKSYVEHHFKASWIAHQNKKQAKYDILTARYRKVFGKRFGTKICRFVLAAKHMGLREAVKHFRSNKQKRDYYGF